MSRFLEPLHVTTEDGRTWTVHEEMDYEVGKMGSGERIVVPEGTKTDFGSIPRMFWWGFSPIGLGTRAYVLHDYLYCVQIYSRAKSDKILLEALGVLGLNWVYRHTIYLAVRSGGWAPWRYRAKQIKKESKNQN
jgi:hypothetical protein